MQINCTLNALILIPGCRRMLSVFMRFYQNLVLVAEYYVMLIDDKHCSDVCCDEFPVSQIDCKSKQVQEQ